MDELCRELADRGKVKATDIELSAESTQQGPMVADDGTLMQHLQGMDQLQQHLWVPCTEEQQRKREILMATIDHLNQRYGRGTVQWAACGLHPGWAMRRERLGRASTTRLDELPTVHC